MEVAPQRLCMHKNPLQALLWPCCKSCGGKLSNAHANFKPDGDAAQVLTMVKRQQDITPNTQPLNMPHAGLKGRWSCLHRSHNAKAAVPEC